MCKRMLSITNGPVAMALKFMRSKSGLQNPIQSLLPSKLTPSTNTKNACVPLIFSLSCFS